MNKSEALQAACQDLPPFFWAPHKVKLAVSGCPRNCAEAAIKDVGIIGVDSGWEIYVGGNGGIKTEVAEFLVKVKPPKMNRPDSGYNCRHRISGSAQRHLYAHLRQ